LSWLILSFGETLDEVAGRWAVSMRFGKLDSDKDALYDEGVEGL